MNTIDKFKILDIINNFIPDHEMTISDPNLIIFVNVFPLYCTIGFGIKYEEFHNYNLGKFSRNKILNDKLYL